MKDVLLNIENLSGISDDRFELNNINLRLHKGEVHVVLCENPSAQNALMSILVGQIRVAQGQVFYENRIVSSQFCEINNIENVAFLLDKRTVIHDLTVAENLLLPSFPRKMGVKFIDWKKVKRNARNIMDKLNVDIDVNMKVSKLTEEEVQLVELAKVFVKGMSLMILQEPTKNLSSPGTQKLFDDLRKYKNDGGSVVYTTKKWEEAIKIGDVISVLKNGTISGRITAKEAKRNPRALLKLLDTYNYRDSGWENHDDEKLNLRKVMDRVFKAAELLTSEYELNDVLMFLAKNIAETMNADGATIVLLDSSTHSIIDTYAYSIQDKLAYSMDINYNMSFLDNDNLDYFHYSNRNNKDFSALFEDSGNVQAVISIPMRIRSRVAGVLHILYSKVYVYSEEEIKYLSAFAQQAALGIEDTRLLGRSALLQESHHRIKNNLQAISSFVALQKQYIARNKNSAKDFDLILDGIIFRIKSIAAVHDLLSKDQLGRSIINISELIGVLVDFTIFDTDINVNIEFENMFIPYSKATSIALLVNELLCNCNKYAFMNVTTEKKVINIVGHREKEHVNISFRDNGVGFPQNFDIKQNKGLGLSLATTIVNNEFGGEINFKNDNGAVISMRIDANKLFLKR